MRIQLKRGYVLVESRSIVRLSGWITTGSWEAKGAALFPFLFVLNKSYIQPWLISHELIHFRQQFETLFIGLPILSFFERLYARFALKLSKEERYLYAAAEQEAYLNMHNPDYLKNRSFGSIFRYVSHKRKFKLVGPGEMEFLDQA